MGKGAIASMSQKQGLNTRSSTEAEIVTANDMAGPIIWLRSTRLLFGRQHPLPAEQSKCDIP